jgi:hypothetical protein
VTLPLLKPGLANAFLVGFIESIADFGNPIVVGGQYAVLSTDIFFAIVGAQYDQGRAASLALILTAFALAVFFVQQRVLGRSGYTTVSGKGDAAMPTPLPHSVRAAAGRRARGCSSRSWSTSSPSSAASCRPGARLHAHARAFPAPPSTCSGACTAWSGRARRGIRSSPP